MNINFTLIAQAIAFAVLIWFTVKFVWPPLLSAIETRQKEIADGLAAASEGRNALEVAAKKSEITLFGYPPTSFIKYLFFLLNCLNL